MNEMHKALLDQMADQRIITKERHEQIRLTVLRRAESGEEVNPFQLLVEQKYVTADQVRRLALSMEKVVVTCYKCLRRSNLSKDGWIGTFICKHCTESVSIHHSTAGFGEELLPNPPARVVDKIVEKLLTKMKLANSQQLAQAKNFRKRRIPRPTLLSVISEMGLVDQQRLIQIKGKAEAVFRKKVPETPRLKQDFELACFLCRLRLVSQKDLGVALQHQLNRAMNAGYDSLRALLQQKGWLTDYQLKEFLPQTFDRQSRRLELLNKVGGQLNPEQDGIDEPDWEDSMIELAEELESTADLNVIDLGVAPEPEEDDERPDDYKKRDNMLKKFYDKELGDIKSMSDLKGRRHK